MTVTEPSAFNGSIDEQPVALLSTGTPPIISAAVNGIPGSYMLDFGNAGPLFFFRAFVESHQSSIDLSHSVTEKVPGVVGGDLEAKLTRIESFSIGPHLRRGAVAAVVQNQSGAFASKSLAGNIGAEILSRFTVTLDYAHARAYFEPNSRYGDLFPARGPAYRMTAPQRAPWSPRCFGRDRLRLRQALTPAIGYSR